MLRPRPARWIEVLCPRADSARVVGILARTGTLEIEVRTPRQGELRLRELTEGLGRFRELSARYARYWSRGSLGQSPEGAPPRRVLAEALERIGRWRREADPLIDRLQSLEDEHDRLGLCRGVIRHLEGSALDFTLLNGLGPFLHRLAALLPLDAALPDPAEAVVRLTLPLERERYLLAVGPAAPIDDLRERVLARHGRILLPPEWLRGTPPEALAQIEERLQRLDSDIDALYARLDGLYAQHRLADALGDLSCLNWFTAQVGVLELASERFAWITGWTSDPAGAVPARALEQAGARALLRLPTPPPGAVPPQLLDNPPWARPFEVFVKALGVPSGSEADPSSLLALVAPLLFGYMFGDLGQGLVLLAAGWALRRRFPLARLLMAAGASAALFGLVFGSLFGMEGVMPALWLHPLDAPLTVLAVPLAFGVLLLTLGQVLDGVEAAWRGALSGWLPTGLPFLLLYLTLAAGTLAPDLLHLAPLWVLLYLFGALRTGGVARALAAAGELLERGLQLLVNSLSFARVGAFALAHAGLSSAVISLADAAGPAAGVPVLILGNLVILLLEGLVVSIQTTRLLLFEFFTRFLRGEGRPFRPLPPPPTFVEGDSR